MLSINTLKEINERFEDFDFEVVNSNCEEREISDTETRYSTIVVYNI